MNYPAQHQGRDIATLRGRSFAELFENPTVRIHPPEQLFAVELFSRKAARRGDWKVVASPPPHGNGEWQLFNLATDPGETQDLAAAYPDITQLLAHAWQQYACGNSAAGRANRLLGVLTMDRRD